MTDICLEFGISRKTGYKIFTRYKEHRLEALSERSRRPVRYAGLAPLGQLVQGAPADIIVIGADPRLNFKELEYPRLVVSGGRVVVVRDQGE